MRITALVFCLVLLVVFAVTNIIARDYSVIPASVIGFGVIPGFVFWKSRKQ